MQMIMFSKKRSHEKIVKKVLKEKNCWKKKKSDGQKDGKEIEQNYNVKNLKQKVDAQCAKFLIDDDHLSIKRYGMIFY